MSLETFALTFNMMRLSNKIAYVNDVNFINDNFQKCIDSNVISKYASTDPIWKGNNITLEDINYKHPCMEYYNPYESLSYDSIYPRQHWSYEIKKVNLPQNWKLIVHNVKLGSFMIIDADNKHVKTLNFFEDEIKDRIAIECLDELTSKMFDVMDEKIKDYQPTN